MKNINFAITELGIKKFLNNSDIKVVVLNETSSTSDDAKNLLKSGLDSVLVVSESQTSGRGRLNREFYSPKDKGVYLSLGLRPNLSAFNASLITSFCGVAVANAIEQLSGVKVGLKWVNDLFINSKKVGGILVESSFSGLNIDYVVIGIGVNVYDDIYPEFIKDVATNIEKESGKKINKNELIARITNNLSNLENQIKSKEFLNEYKERQIILNKQIKVVTPSGEFYSTAIDIDKSGALIVENNGEKQLITAGDVSIRF